MFLTYILIVNTLAVALSVLVLRVSHIPPGSHRNAWYYKMLKEIQRGKKIQEKQHVSKCSKDDQRIVTNGSPDGSLLRCEADNMKTGSDVDGEQDHDLNWKHIAVTFDLVFFWVIMTLMLLPSIVMLVGVPLSKPDPNEWHQPLWSWMFY